MNGQNGNRAKGKLLIEADMDAAETRAYRRHLWVVDPGPLPFEQLSVMSFEEAAQEMVADLGEDPIGHYELMFMYRGYRLCCDHFLGGKGERDPVKDGLRAYDCARLIHHPAVANLSMTEQAKMFGESKANLSYRIKQLSKKLRRLGQKGFRLPGQKTPEASATYSKAQQGNSNRRRGNARQKSFLCQFAQTKPKQKSFMRKLNKNNQG